MVRTLGSGQSKEVTGGRGKVMSLDFILSAKKNPLEKFKQ